MDGEGTIYSDSEGAEMSVSNTNADVIFSIHNTLNIGSTSEVHFENQPEWKTKYTWRLRRYKDLSPLLEKLIPFLTIKKNSAIKAWQKIRAFDQSVNEREQRNQCVRQMVASGMRHKDVAAALGLTRSLVTYIVNHTSKGSSDPTLSHKKYEQRHRKSPVSVRTSFHPHEHKPEGLTA